MSLTIAHCLSFC